MATTPTSAATAPESRRARKLAARKEREIKHREARNRAKAVEEPGPAPARKRHRVVRNKETPEWARLQARRWLENERRKIDRGGLTPLGIEHFTKWTRNGDLQNFTAARQCSNANVAIERFLNEKRSVQKAQGKDIGGKDWWAGTPRLPRSKRQKWAKGKAVTTKDHHQENMVAASTESPWILELPDYRVTEKDDEKGVQHNDGDVKDYPEHLLATLADVGGGDVYQQSSSDMTPEPVSRHSSEGSEDHEFDVDMDHEPFRRTDLGVGVIRR
ncbi:MAG: hypothetical protein Q9176_002688 [Flavoplaca citrina]